MSNAIVSVDEETLKGDLRELVRKTVQDTINALLEEEADEMVGAERYERTAGREAYRSGHYKRKLVTTSGEVVLDVPKRRGATFQAASRSRRARPCPACGTPSACSSSCLLLSIGRTFGPRLQKGILELSRTRPAELENQIKVFG